MCKDYLSFLTNGESIFKTLHYKKEMAEMVGCTAEYFEKVNLSDLFLCWSFHEKKLLGVLAMTQST